MPRTICPICGGYCRAPHVDTINWGGRPLERTAVISGGQRGGKQAALNSPSPPREREPGEEG